MNIQLIIPNYLISVSSVSSFSLFFKFSSLGWIKKKTETNPNIYIEHRIIKGVAPSISAMIGAPMQATRANTLHIPIADAANKVGNN
jgi:hypothetical protein